MLELTQKTKNELRAIKSREELFKYFRSYLRILSDSSEVAIEGGMELALKIDNLEKRISIAGLDCIDDLIDTLTNELDYLEISNQEAYSFFEDSNNLELELLINANGRIVNCFSFYEFKDSDSLGGDLDRSFINPSLERVLEDIYREIAFNISDGGEVCSSYFIRSEQIAKRLASINQ